MSIGTARRNLWAIAAAYAKGAGTSVGAVGKKFYGRSDFFPRFRDGTQSISLTVYFKLIDQMRERWPDGARWPALRPIEIAAPKARRGKTPPKALPPGTESPTAGG